MRRDVHCLCSLVVQETLRHHTLWQIIGRTISITSGREIATRSVAKMGHLGQQLGYGRRDTPTPTWLKLLSCTEQCVCHIPLTI